MIGSRWSRKAIKSFAMAELEARKLKYSTTGTEALLMGILIEGNKSFGPLIRVTFFNDCSVKILYSHVTFKFFSHAQ